MNRQHTRARLAAAAGCALLSLTACEAAPKHVGRAPEGARRARTDEILAGRRGRSPQAGKDGGEAVADEAARNLRRERRLEAESDTVVIGLYGTKVYHQPRCELLGDAHQSERVTFVSCYDGLDDGYRPCTRCTPGP